MKKTLTLFAISAASPALAHGDTPFHPESPAMLMAGLAVLAVAITLALFRRGA